MNISWSKALNSISEFVSKDLGKMSILGFRADLGEKDTLDSEKPTEDLFFKDLEV